MMNIFQGSLNKWCRSSNKVESGRNTYNNGAEVAYKNDWISFVSPNQFCLICYSVWSYMLDIKQILRNFTWKQSKRTQGYLMNRKITTGMTHFLGSYMISWAIKKHHYVALSTSCAKLLWIKQQLKNFGWTLNGFQSSVTTQVLSTWPKVQFNIRGQITLISETIA